MNLRQGKSRTASSIFKEVSKRTTYSIASIRWLSRAGLMPPIIRIGANRVGMASRTLQQWNAQGAKTRTLGEQNHKARESWYFSGREGATSSRIRLPTSQQCS